MDNYLKALLAGIFFGIYPLFMNKSGLHGSATAFAFGIGLFLLAAPFAFMSSSNAADIKWPLVIFFVILACTGVLMYTSAIASVDKKDVSTLIMLLVISQTVVATGMYAMLNSSLSPMKFTGFILAGVAAVMLIKG